MQQPSSDPHIESFDEADLSGLTQEVPVVTERARAKWEDEPRSIRLTSDPLPRPGVSRGVRKMRRRPGPPREG